MEKSRSVEIIDNHIKALEEELEWYQERNAKMNEIIEDYKNKIAEMNRVPPARVYAELIDNNKKLVEENARLREQLRWHSVDELPEHSDYYLVRRTADINGMRGIVSSILPYSDLFGWTDSNVLKWMPIPEDGEA